MLAGNAAFEHRWDFSDPAQMAVQLGGVFGPFLKNAILLLMINAAVLGTATISLSSAWAYGEVKGWPHSLHYFQSFNLAARSMLLRPSPISLFRSV